MVLPRGSLNLIEQGTQRRPGPGVADDALPCRITIELREQIRQSSRKILTLGRRKTLNRGFDVLDSTHRVRLPQERDASNSQLLGSD